MSSNNLPVKQNHLKKRVLIVDDMPQVLHDLHQLLELTGLFEIVAEAKDGLEAVHLAAELSPEVVVMDLEMPRLNGYEATRLIKAHHPTMRLIILSAYASHEEMDRARKSGADGFVMKGDRYEILVNAILGIDDSPNILKSEKGE